MLNIKAAVLREKHAFGDKPRGTGYSIMRIDCTEFQPSSLYSDCWT